jgi:hypothetical protein
MEILFRNVPNDLLIKAKTFKIVDDGGLKDLAFNGTKIGVQNLQLGSSELLLIDNAGDEIDIKQAVLDYLGL